MMARGWGDRDQIDPPEKSIVKMPSLIRVEYLQMEFLSNRLLYISVTASFSSKIKYSTVVMVNLWRRVNYCSKI